MPAKAKKKVSQRKRGRPKKNSTGPKGVVDKDKILELSEKGVHQGDIANMLGCSQQNISQVLQRVNEQRNLIHKFSTNEADIWDYNRAKALSKLSDAVITKVVDNINTPRDYKDFMTGNGISVDKSQVLKGKATQIFSMVEHQDDIKDIQALQEQIQELIQQPDGSYAPQDVVLEPSDNNGDKSKSK